MKYRIPVYRAEIEAGVADDIQANASLAYCVPIATYEPTPEFVERARRQLAVASATSIDLFHVKGILTSTGWNNNDDIFDKVETWTARHTPVNKPFNLGHDQNDIIGHIVASYAVNDDLSLIDDATAIDDLPGRFHIVDDSVVYRGIGGEERVDLIERTIAEIRAGEWYESMETFFLGFDYGIIDPEGKTHVLKRDQATAHLTPYLRAYPPKEKLATADRRHGSGTYLDANSGKEYRIGRMMRNMTFAGKGLVRKPGNPNSIILSTASLSFSPDPVDAGYMTTMASEIHQEVSPVEPNAELQQALATIEGLKQTIAELQSKGHEAKVSDLQGQVAARDQSIAALNTQVSTLTETVTGVTRRAEAVEAELAAVKSEVATARLAETKRTRLAVAVEKGFAPDKAVEFVDKLVVLDDVAFAATLETVSAAIKPAVTAPAKPANDIERIDRATPEPEPTLTTAGESPGADADEISNFFANNLLRTTRGRSQKES